MSVEQINKIDFIVTDEKENRVILTVSDHLEWEPDNGHLLVLQNKINAYLSFIESGQIFQVYPSATNRQIVISVCTIYKPDEKGLTFLLKVKEIVEGAGFGFEILRIT